MVTIRAAKHGMKHYQVMLKKVGGVLIVIGIVDIGFMIYYLSNMQTYVSGNNIFAVVAGIFCINCNLRAVRVIALFSALYIVGTIDLMFIIVAPFLNELSLQGRYGLLDFFLSSVYLGALLWVYRSLTSEPIRTAMDRNQVDYSSFWRKPSLGFWIGGVYSLILLIGYLCGVKV